jgi:hypothetical protein
MGCAKQRRRLRCSDFCGKTRGARRGRRPLRSVRRDRPDAERTLADTFREEVGGSPLPLLDTRRQICLRPSTATSFRNGTNDEGARPAQRIPPTLSLTSCKEFENPPLFTMVPREVASALSTG